MNDSKRQNDSLNDYFHTSIEQPHTEVVSVLNKKWARVSTSVYMVTYFVPESDPIRNEIRKTTLRILSFINVYGSSDRLASQRAVQNAAQETDHLISLFKVGYGAGYISEMNFDMVTGALKKIREQFVTMSQVVRKSPVQELMLEDPLKDFEDIPFTKNKTTRKTKRHEKQNDTKNKTTRKNNTTPKVGETSRSDAILSFMKTTDRKEVSINDIHAVLNDISLKTLQRDMNTLIDAGLVKKEGSKRWSRYSLGD
jgi:hypothetical protein